MASVTAIVPTRDRPDFAAAAVLSIVNQTRPPNEIIVADDGDGSTGAALVLRFGVRAVNTGGQGPAIARNRAAELAQGDWLAFCDDDDTWLPGRLERQWNVERDDVALVFADALRSDGTREWTGRGPAEGSVFDQLLLDNWIPTSTVILRREVFRRVGGFETRFCPAEDYRLWLRVARQEKFAKIDEPLATYRQHAGQLQQNIARMFGATAEAIEDALREDGRAASDIAGLPARLCRLRFVQGRALMRVGNAQGARRAYREAAGHQPAHLCARLFRFLSYLGI